jgi:hypothetical protein
VFALWVWQVETPLELATGLSLALNNRLFLKREDLQPVFSFKLRGAYNKMASLSAEQRQRGVIASSAGNHAQGVALAASKLVSPHMCVSCPCRNAAQLGYECAAGRVEAIQCVSQPISLAVFGCTYRTEKCHGVRAC